MVQAARPEQVAADWAVFDRARDGDASAWGLLAARHQPGLTALALFVTRSASAADDVVQETFLRAMEARIRHRSGSVRGFLATIAYRLALKESMREGRTVDIAGTEPHDGRADPLAGLLSQERDRHVAAAIAGLDQDHREVLALRFYGDHSYEEIASLLHIPLGTVKSRIFYAVRACRTRLREEGILE